MRQKWAKHSCDDTKTIVQYVQTLLNHTLDNPSSNCVTRTELRNPFCCAWNKLSQLFSKQCGCVASLFADACEFAMFPSLSQYVHEPPRDLSRTPLVWCNDCFYSARCLCLCCFSMTLNSTFDIEERPVVATFIATHRHGAQLVVQACHRTICDNPCDKYKSSG